MSSMRKRGRGGHTGLRMLLKLNCFRCVEMTRISLSLKYLLPAPHIEHVNFCFCCCFFAFLIMCAIMWLTSSKEERCTDRCSAIKAARMRMRPSRASGGALSRPCQLPAASTTGTAGAAVAWLELDASEGATPPPTAGCATPCAGSPQFLLPMNARQDVLQAAEGVPEPPLPEQLQWACCEGIMQP